MNRQANLLTQRPDQLLRRVGTAEAGHVLDREDVGAHALELLGELDVVLE